MDVYSDVLFEEITGKGGDLGIITLNRPAVLNSLNHTMIQAMHAQLAQWATANHIKAVLIRAAEGRAFCAGGDIRDIYERVKAHDRTAHYFFRDEYNLNRFIFHFPKPYIALLNGITMGGGVGISLHGSHRIATEQLMFAMPETGIGFYPDVGGSYFLPRLRANMGFYLGLSGARLGSDDCVALGIAQAKVPSHALSELVAALTDQSFGEHAVTSVTEIINQFKVIVKPSPFMEQQDIIQTCFANDSMETILRDLQQSNNEFCKTTAHTLAKKSPTSLKITLRAMQAGRHLEFDDCMRQEYRLTSHFLEGHDFLEGVRAAIIDKDQSPRWRPSTLEEVSQHEIEKYFSPLAEELA
jgi:enoyl-CoA hydratase